MIEPAEITVRVGNHGPGGYPDYVTFLGTEIRQIPVTVEESEEFERTRWYTVFSTPEEGLKVHEQETVRLGSMERPPGQRSAEVREVAARLFTEDELRQERPEIVRFVLERD